MRIFKIKSNSMVNKRTDEGGEQGSADVDPIMNNTIIARIEALEDLIQEEPLTLNDQPIPLIPLNATLRVVIKAVNSLIKRSLTVKKVK